MRFAGSIPYAGLVYRPEGPEASVLRGRQQRYRRVIIIVQVSPRAEDDQTSDTVVSFEDAPALGGRQTSPCPKKRLTILVTAKGQPALKLALEIFQVVPVGNVN
jgi:hypothetical protein